jgi:glutathione S-transferase
VLAPTVRTLRRAPFVFGEAPSLADAALYGNLAMLFEADRALPGALAAELPGYMSRLERLIPSR